MKYTKVMNISKSYLTDYNYWHFFLTLEDDLLVLEKYVEFTKDNLSVYSSEILKLFFLCSSEFEDIMKELGRIYNYKDISESKNDRNITIKTIIKLIDKTPLLSCMKGEIILYKNLNLSFTPINELWNKDCSWWLDYNAVKHNRTMNYQKAKLENLLKSMGALFLANIFLYESKFHNEAFNLESNISIVLANLKKTNLLEFSNKQYYRLCNASFLS